MKRVEALKPTQTATKPDTKKLIADFLKAMITAVEKTYPDWSSVYIDGVRDYAPEGSEDHRQVIDIQPLDDFYFAGVVALEAAKIRRYLEPTLAGDLLMELAAQVDTAAGRRDRIVSDLVFFMLGRLELESGLHVLTMPYDKVIQMMLQRIGVDRIEATRPLMADFAFRHSLGEPLARWIPDWWKAQSQKLKRQEAASRQFGHLDIAAE